MSQQNTTAQKNMDAALAAKQKYMKQMAKQMAKQTKADPRDDNVRHQDVAIEICSESAIMLDRVKGNR